MALRFCDSFDHYASGDGGNKYNLGVGAFTIDTSNARSGAAGLRLGASNTSGSAELSLDNQSTWIMGFAFRSAATYASQAGTTVCTFSDNATVQAIVSHDSSTRKLAVYRGAGSALLGTGTQVLTADVWYYVEIKILFHGSTGTFELRVDGVTDTSGTGVNTAPSGNNYANRLRLGSSTSQQGGYFRYDDFYACDGTGSSPNNDFLGDVRVEALFPNGNGNSSQWVGSDSNSTDNYLLVDEANQNGDTDYVQASSVGDKDTYTYTNLTPTLGSVFGVQAVPFARKTDAGFRRIVSVARLSTTETDSSEKNLSTSYNYFPDVRETKPGGGAWSITDVNSAEFGVKVST